MSGFIKQLYLPDQHCSFLLSEIFVPEGRRFLVSTVKEGKSVLFEIGCEGMKGWRIYDPAPCWVKGIEPRLIGAIKAHLEIFDEDQ